MQLQHQFTLPIPPDQAWTTLLDVKRLASCMPGATLDHIDGDQFSGRVTVKVGPLRLTYRGDARVVEKDEAARRLVIEATGNEARGSGTAAAAVTASLEPSGDGTRVDLLTDLTLTGRPAQFGRGLISEVGGSVIGQFADRLSLEMRNGGTGGQTLTDAPELPRTREDDGTGRLSDEAVSHEPGVPPATQPAATAQADQDSLDLLSLLGPAGGKRALLAGAGIAVLLAAFLLGRRGSRSRVAVPMQNLPWPLVVIVDPERR
ncbi:SRPBCC family protein [Microtetraspora malaysiensis]|uniref:SRPBCC family protein n=1 Tax=Microtetraspora malaysiensis TaxID=161358 RepID=UPI003D945B2A